MKQPFRAIKQLPRAAAVWLIRFYQRCISPLLCSSCRFHPTCSEYMLQSIQKYGLIRGSGKGVLRLLKCHPFHPGGMDLP